ncbi:ATP-binding protein [Winogradskyella sp. 3972H.M.0a.05]|uniref:sensor histidine kinase n=1 Tax=Winogradskyella sp. 3972H.M.0a.05 TaxID=2950277 RepID=UPI003399BB18
MKLKTVYPLFFILIFTLILKSQNQNPSTVLLKNLRERKISQLSDCLESSINKINKKEYYFYKWELSKLRNGINDSFVGNKIIYSGQKNHRQEFMSKIYRGEKKILEHNSNLAYNEYKKALKFALKLKDSSLVCTSLYRILLLKSQNHKLALNVEKYIKMYQRYANNQLEKSYAEYYNIYFNKVGDKKNLKRGLMLCEESNNYYCELLFYQHIGFIYSSVFKESDSAEYFYSNALNIIDNNKTEYFLQQHRKKILFNLGYIKFSKKNYKSALSYFNQANLISTNHRRLEDDSIISHWKYKIYKNLKIKDSALAYLEKKDSINRALILYREKLISNDENSKYYNPNSESVKLVLAIFSLKIIFCGILIIKNLHKKREKIKQEKLIKEIMLQNLIKEQEIKSISDVILGQEKERKLIADELHDDLGGLLTTLKLFLQNIKVQKNEMNKHDSKLFNKAEELVNEAYIKVRNIAHTKNSGVMVKEEFLPTLKNFADTVSSYSSLNINIDDFALDRKLNKSIELTLFSIIQELITNVIKHSEATMVNIHFTSLSNNLNVIFEDNGIGFNYLELNNKKAMGINSIKSRIKGLKGKINIDSTPGVGTSIILNIPIA